MAVIWLNGTIGSGKSAIGAAVAKHLPTSIFLDGDDCAGPAGLPDAARWRHAEDTLIRAAGRPGGVRWLVIAYLLDARGFRRLRAACGRAGRQLLVINLAPPLRLTLRGRGGRVLSAGERRRVRVMRSQGYHRRPFAELTWPNAFPSVRSSSLRLARLACGHYLAHRSGPDGGPP
jgi:hypothetical protein